MRVESDVEVVCNRCRTTLEYDEEVHVVSVLRWGSVCDYVGDLDPLIPVEEERWTLRNFEGELCAGCFAKLNLETVHQ